MSDWAGIVWLVVLLVVNAFFVGAEFAVISARRSQIEPKAQAGSKSAQTALWAMEHATLMLATCQLGITICSLLILNVSEPAIHHLLEEPLAWTGLSPVWVGTVAFIIALLLVTYLHVVFGEMVPKNAAFSLPDRAVLILAPPLVFVSKVLNPVIWAMNAIANGILRLCGVEPKDEANATFTLDEVASIVNYSTQEGTLEDRAGTLSAAFEFTEKKVGDLTIAPDDLTVLPAEATALDVEAAVTRHGYSRYLIAAPEGGIRGYVHVKDLLRLKPERLTQPINPKRIRDLMNLSAATDVEDALAQMQQTGVHLARVFTNQGVELGVVFLEDIIEELVGEVHDATQRQRFA